MILTDKHSFDRRVAKEYGIPAAILLSNIAYWIEKNRENEKHFIEGRTWTYNSVAAFGRIFDYMGQKQIRAALDALIAGRVLMKGDYGSGGDRSTWYAFVDEIEWIGPANHLPKRANAFAEKGKPLAEKGKCTNKADVNTDVTALPEPEEQPVDNSASAAKPAKIKGGFSANQFLKDNGADPAEAERWLHIRDAKKALNDKEAFDYLGGLVRLSRCSWRDYVRHCVAQGVSQYDPNYGNAAGDAVKGPPRCDKPLAEAMPQLFTEKGQKPPGLGSLKSLVRLNFQREV